MATTKRNAKSTPSPFKLMQKVRLTTPLQENELAIVEAIHGEEVTVWNKARARIEHYNTHDLIAA